MASGCTVAMTNGGTVTGRARMRTRIRAAGARIRAALVLIQVLRQATTAGQAATLGDWRSVVSGRAIRAVSGRGSLRGVR